MALSSTTNAITTHKDDASARLQHKSLCFPPFSRNPTEFTMEDSKFLSTDTLVHQTWTLLDKRTVISEGFQIYSIVNQSMCIHLTILKSTLTTS